MKKYTVNIEKDIIISLKQAIKIASSFESNINDDSSGANFIEELSNLLYIQWYTKSDVKKKFELFPHEDWGQIFNAAHKGTYHWERGWKVLKVSSAGRVIAVRNDEERMLYPGDYISTVRLGVLPAPGTEVEVVSRRDSVEDQPGFWISYSSTWSQVSKDIIRIYWNVSPEGSIHLIEEITEKFNNSFPYSFKVPIDEIGYQRADTAVLYFGSSDFQKVQPILKSIYKEMKSFLYPDTPGFTKVLEAGMGLAEDPLDKSESFGMNRCRLIAQGYKKALEQGLNTILELDESIQNYLTDEGVNLSCPYLTKGSHDAYEW